MGINFPAAPIVGALYPDPAIAGIPQYKWDGTAWLAMTPSALTYVQRGGDTMTGHLALPTAPAAANAVRRDFVEAYAAPFDAMAYSGMQINGSMEVDQAVAGNVTSSSYTTPYFIDGWVVQAGGAVQVLASVLSAAPAPPAGFQSHARIYTTVAVAGSLAVADMGRLITYIEGYRVAKLAWGTASAQPITIGFWVHAAVTGTITVTTQNWDETRSYPVNVSVTAGVWAYKTITIPGDIGGVWQKTNGIGLKVSFCFGGGTSFHGTANTWNSAQKFATSATSNGFATAGSQSAITGVVVLPGSQAPTAAQSPMIMRPYDQELVTCKRYLRIITPEGAGLGNTATAYFTIRHDGMRATPTISTKDILVVTDVFAANYIQSSAHAGAAGNFPDYGMYTFGNFTIGATKAVIFQPGSNSNQNRVMFDARL
jgi:hypothetical protein